MRLDMTNYSSGADTSGSHYGYIGDMDSFKNIIVLNSSLLFSLIKKAASTSSSSFNDIAVRGFERYLDGDLSSFEKLIIKSSE